MALDVRNGLMLSGTVPDAGGVPGLGGAGSGAAFGEVFSH